MDRRNFLSSLVVLMFFVLFYFLSEGLAQNARYWPKLVCVIGGTISATNMLAAFYKMRAAGNGVPVFPLSGAQAGRFLGITAVSALWVAGIMNIGYLVSSAAATMVLVLAFEPVKDFRHLGRNVLITLCFSFIAYGLFALLGVQFPEGLLI